MVFGIECAALGDLSADEVANAVIEACYLGRSTEDGCGEGIHLLGALAGNVLRISPPMTMTDQQATESLAMLHDLISEVAVRLQGAAV